jgi:hypothetical protein
MLRNRFLTVLACFAAAALASGAPSVEKGDEAVLRALNADYIGAFLKGDAARFGDLLADDFRCILTDGREVTKSEFLKQSAPPAVKDFRNEDVRVRLYENTAVVSARVSYKRPDGSEAETRYVNVYVRRAGRWQVVSAQSTRVTKP